MPDVWPALPPWEATRDTLHRFTQVVGKVRLALTPWTNHSWHAPLYVTPRGLATSSIPHGTRLFQVDLDLVGHQLVVVSDRDPVTVPLQGLSVAGFHEALLGALDGLGLGVVIHGAPNEVADPTPFARDDGRAEYDPVAVAAFAGALRQAHRVLSAFRAPFTGKVSPVHFFWGSFDLAVTRFSGRPAPEHPGGIPNLPDWVAREAYSHEVSSAGFWPGDADHPAVFYSYAYPEPEGYTDAPVRPGAARYHPELREFVLSYDAVRTAQDPDAALMGFLRSTFQAAHHDAWGDLEVEHPPLARPRRLRPGTPTTA